MCDRRLRSAGLALCALALIASRARAQCGVFLETTVFLGDDTQANDEFGAALALDGDVALVGLGRGSTPEDGAYFFRRVAGQWMQEGQFISNILGACSYGFSVALDGNVGVVGDWTRELGGFCKGTGAASLYRYDGTDWVLEQNLIAPNGVLAFGYSLALHRNRLLGGAPGQNPPVQRPPAVLFYEYSAGSWMLRETFAAADSSFGDGFGESIAISEDGNTVVVGAPNLDVSGASSAGAAYVFRFDGSNWIEEQKLVAGDPSLLDSFGTSVSVAGDVVAVGAPWDDALFPDAGSVYLFRHDGTRWVQTQNVSAGRQQSNGRFGIDVELDGDRLVVGEFLSDRAHLYHDVGGAYRLVQSLAPSSESGSEWFGYRVALDGERCLVGAPFSNRAGSTSGAVYEFAVQDLSLSHSPRVGQVGQSVTFTTCGGIPGERSLLAVLGGSVSGAFPRPTLGLMQPLIGVFVEGRSSVTLDLPPGLAGRTLRLQAFGKIAPGVRGKSNVVSLPVN